MDTPAQKIISNIIYVLQRVYYQRNAASFGRLSVITDEKITFKINEILGVCSVNFTKNNNKCSFNIYLKIDKFSGYKQRIKVKLYQNT